MESYVEEVIKLAVDQVREAASKSGYNGIITNSRARKLVCVERAYHERHQPHFGGLENPVVLFLKHRYNTTGLIAISTLDMKRCSCVRGGAGRDAHCFIEL